MNIGDFSSRQLLTKTSAATGLSFDVGVFSVNLQTSNVHFLHTFQELYAEFPVLADDAFIDFHIRLAPSTIYRSWIKPQIKIRLNDQEPFQPFSADHAMPLFEWGLNWCIYKQAHQNLMLHAAVLEKQGNAIVLPALPGSGKSTLAAALAHSGWRFLSDEFCIIRPEDRRILPIPRPTPLKNGSIDIIRQFAPNAFIGPLFTKTRKGTIGHLRSPSASVAQLKTTATPRLIVFPHYNPEVSLDLTLLNKAYAFLKLATNAFNYDIQGETGFRLVKEMINNCDCYSLSYNDLHKAIKTLDQLLEDIQ